jgi:hypothetical protein
MAFTTTSSGWAVGKKGTILHTEDSGSTWKNQAGGIRSDADSVAFITPRSGWVVGEGGVILHTEDGGRTWRLQASGTRAQLVEVNFVTPQSGWVVGHGGTILHTEDGGSTWRQQKSGTDADLQSVGIVRPYGVIGVQLKDVPNPAGTRAPVASYGEAVVGVVPGGPADEAGLKAGDTVVALNGEKVKSSDDFATSVFALKPGSDARVEYIREGKNGTADVRIGDGSKPFASRAGH